MQDARRISDARTLRALAHPVRVALVEELAFGGPATASELAERVGESPANCSWHLRQLAKYGFVEEAEGGQGRRRPWQVVAEPTTVPETDDPETNQAGRALEALMEERWFSELRAYHAREHDETAEWRESAFVTNAVAWLTPKEMREISDSFMELLTQHLERINDPTARPEGARPVRIVGWGFPARPAPTGGES